MLWSVGTVNVNRPFGTDPMFGRDPTLKRWAIVGRPSGTTNLSRRDNVRIARRFNAGTGLNGSKSRRDGRMFRVQGWRGLNVNFGRPFGTEINRNTIPAFT